MTIPASVQHYLDQRSVQYDLLPHAHTHDSMHTANTAHIPGSKLAKSVLLGDDGGYILAVVPATHRIDLGVLSRRLHRRLGLATESEVGRLFEDCDLGAVPPLGPAYGIETVVDESLMHCRDVYFEAGDHTDLVHVSGRDFMLLIDGGSWGSFSHPT
jgi:Ala-tRNA(Pro) deacylase